MVQESIFPRRHLYLTRCSSRHITCSNLIHNRKHATRSNGRSTLGTRKKTPLVNRLKACRSVLLTGGSFRKRGPSRPSRFRLMTFCNFSFSANYYVTPPGSIFPAPPPFVAWRSSEQEIAHYQPRSRIWNSRPTAHPLTLRDLREKGQVSPYHLSPHCALFSLTRP
jgi:hypothetical protein